ncbi:uncharacterized protein LOC8051672 [Ixodes scapularis]|uniref:uncharacterized protein LOC8051672 n=1 Tax=Ixodes scapularis TaxID=6945 RepID=UPI001C387E87|nr:uncharacterized protein LOC8051672 [Ixodes scapularis]
MSCGPGDERRGREAVQHPRSGQQTLPLHEPEGTALGTEAALGEVHLPAERAAQRLLDVLVHALFPGNPLALVPVHRKERTRQARTETAPEGNKLPAQKRQGLPPLTLGIPGKRPVLRRRSPTTVPLKTNPLPPRRRPRLVDECVVPQTVTCRMTPDCITDKVLSRTVESRVASGLCVWCSTLREGVPGHAYKLAACCFTSFKCLTFMRVHVEVLVIIAEAALICLECRLLRCQCHQKYFWREECQTLVYGSRLTGSSAKRDVSNYKLRS